MGAGGGGGGGGGSGEGEVLVVELKPVLLILKLILISDTASVTNVCSYRGFLPYQLKSQ